MPSLDLKNSIGTRLFIIASLTMIFLIPSCLVQDLITERETRRNSVANEISQKWGAEQTIVGPVLTIPYYHLFERNNKLEKVKRYAHFLPEDLTIKGSITPEVRYRSIYEVIVYNSKLSMSGKFPAIDLKSFEDANNELLINSAFLSLGISDMTGIKDFIKINWNGQEYLANPGIESNDVVESGISISTKQLSPEKANIFSFDLNLNGSSQLLFSPVGKQTNVHLASDWSNPSFVGSFLPNRRQVDESGFTADWKVLHLNRNFPQQWLGDNQEVSQTSFGVNLLLSVDEYQKTMRTTKYAIMFIALTFLTFFMIELLSRKVIHPLQYILIGFALLIFYTLLLSISEYLVFTYAYIIASAAIILLITIYSYSVLSDKLKTGIILGVLILLYGYLYILLQLQDYALLMGSIALFVILAIVMYLTRNVDWFDVMSANKKTKADLDEIN